MIERIKGWLAGIGLALAAILAAFLRGRSEGVSREKAKQDRNTIETVERIDEAKRNADGADWRERLRRSKRK